MKTFVVERVRSNCRMIGGAPCHATGIESMKDESGIAIGASPCTMVWATIYSGGRC